MERYPPVPRLGQRGSWSKRPMSVERSTGRVRLSGALAFGPGFRNGPCARSTRLSGVASRSSSDSRPDLRRSRASGPEPSASQRRPSPDGGHLVRTQTSWILLGNANSEGRAHSESLRSTRRPATRCGICCRPALDGPLLPGCWSPTHAQTTSHNTCVTTPRTQFYNFCLPLVVRTRHG